jgi:flagellar biosynthesis regulator FlaF
MYQFAYSAICEEFPAPSSTPSNYFRLPDAVELIEAAGKARPASAEQLQLLSDFRKLWLAVSNDLIRGGHGLSPEVHTVMLSATHSVLEEIERCRFKKPVPPRTLAAAQAPELLL